VSRSPVEIIHGPLITEKAYAQYQQGKYTFRVSTRATKTEIAHALEEHYQDQGIKVVKVNTMNVQGKLRRGPRRTVTGRTPGWKKAVVTLEPGQKLEGLFGSL
jgi:large subunit ribosomal protein L23